MGGVSGWVTEALADASRGVEGVPSLPTRSAALCATRGACVCRETGGESRAGGCDFLGRGGWWLGHSEGWRAVLALATLGPTDARRSSARASPPKCPSPSPASTPPETCGWVSAPAPPSQLSAGGQERRPPSASRVARCLYQLRVLGAKARMFSKALLCLIS